MSVLFSNPYHLSLDDCERNLHISEYNVFTEWLTSGNIIKVAYVVKLL